MATFIENLPRSLGNFELFSCGLASDSKFVFFNLISAARLHKPSMIGNSILVGNFNWISRSSFAAWLLNWEISFLIVLARTLPASFVCDRMSYELHFWMHVCQPFSFFHLCIIFAWCRLSLWLWWSWVVWVVSISTICNCTTRRWSSGGILQLSHHPVCVSANKDKGKEKDKDK